MTNFEKTIEFQPSRSWRHADPKKDYGNTAVTIRFTLKGEKGAVHWMIGTHWVIKPIRGLTSLRPDIFNYERPEGWDLGYHSPKPLYDEHHVQHEDCPVIGGPCYYDGSSLNAELMIEGFLGHGESYVWEKLEAFYRNVFDDGPWPEFEAPYLPHPDNEGGNENDDE